MICYTFSNDFWHDFFFWFFDGRRLTDHERVGKGVPAGLQALVYTWAFFQPSRGESGFELKLG